MSPGKIKQIQFSMFAHTHQSVACMAPSSQQFKCFIAASVMLSALAFVQHYKKLIRWKSLLHLASQDMHTGSDIYIFNLKLSNK